MEQVRIVKEMRERDGKENGRAAHLRRHRFLIWENVSGAYSSNTGRDFQAVLTEIIRIAEPETPDVPMPEKGGWPKARLIYDELGKWSVAWRTHDSQWWGVPQRRRRISVLADFNGLTAGEILFDPQYERTTENGEPVSFERNPGGERRPEVQPLPESVSGDSEQGEQARQETAGTAGTSPDQAGKCLNGWDVQSKHVQPTDGIAEALYAGETRYGGGESYVLDESSPEPIPINSQVGTRQAEERRTAMGVGEPGDPQFTLSASHHHAVFAKGTRPHSVEESQEWKEAETANTLNTNDTGESRANEIVVKTYGIGCFNSKGMLSDNPEAGIYEAETSRTLDLNGGNPACNQGGMAIVCLNDQGGSTMDVSEDKTGTLRAENHGHPPLVAYGFEPGAAQRLNTESRFAEETAPTLRADAGDNQGAVVSIENHPHDSRVSIREDGTVQTLSKQMGTGGNNVPLVLCKTLTEKRYFEWNEDDISVTLRNAGASYGGGSEVLVIEEKGDQP